MAARIIKKEFEKDCEWAAFIQFKWANGKWETHIAIKSLGVARRVWNTIYWDNENWRIIIDKNKAYGYNFKK